MGAVDRDLLNLSGRVALVTGAGQGVGATIADYLAAHGAAVAVNDVVADRADRVANEIRESGATSAPFAADVTSLESVLSMVNAIKQQLGVVDILVNNAGNAGVGVSQEESVAHQFWETGPDSWRRFVDVNLYGVLNCCRSVLPGMIAAAHGGRVITIISDAGRVGEPRLEVYSAAKAGAAGFMRALAKSVGRYAITANCVALATMRTPEASFIIDNPKLADRVLRQLIIRRFGEPSDAAALVTFLASPAAGWITAQTYPVNGGYSAAQ